MRYLIIILLFFSHSLHSQVLVLGAIESIEPPPPQLIGTFIDDQFSGSSLDGQWDPQNLGLQSISESGGKLNVTCSNGSDLSPALRISNTGWGYSMLRNYYMETEFRFTTTGKGVFIGVTSGRPTGSSSTYGCIDVTAGRLKIFGANGSDQFDNLPANAALSVTINNSSDYYMKLEVNEDAATLTLSNLTLSQTQVLSFNYSFVSPSFIPLRPNIFQYSFGASGNTQVSFDYVKVSSNEQRFPKYVCYGNSITTGYFGGLATNSWAYKLRPHTSSVLQIMAGGGCILDDYLNNINEMLYIQPQYFIFMMGTNDNGNFAAAWTKYQTLVSTMQAAGINCIHLPIVNGGNPNTPGIYNNNIKTTYPTTFIDIWTTGWNTMTVGNGEMADGLHPTNAGMIKLANIVRSARPDLFPL